ncbi:NADPH2:quinone reductase [Curtobacterium flaccumfaciens]|uniref:NADPH2:quinone reductase n=1 Tax=Curtobacterium salicis TaxID=1779862 RepID=A0ABX0T9V7_9MICO|nr:NADPH:quinone reductase [Curtobacterium sp. WW7]NII40978.1 NADPH2:quinone reductase [Curtobacterium sp. WW7]
MRAVWYDRQGPAAEVLRAGTIDTPEPAAGEVLVHLTRSGVNPGDTKKREGWLGSAMPYDRVVPHSDGAGVVDAVGPSVDPALVGTRVAVYGAQSYRAPGTAAEYVVVPAGLAVPLPDAVSDDVAAALGIPGITAHRAVFADGPVRGRTVLVHGVRGAVGSIAAQLAAAAGARLIVTVRRSSDVDGLDAPAGSTVVALDDDPVAAIRRIAPDGVDRVVEVALDANADLDAAVIANDGVIATYFARGDRVDLPFPPLLFANVLVRFLGSDDFAADVKRSAMEALVAAVAEGSLVVGIRTVLPLDEAAAAHDLVDAGGSGRVLLDTRR